MENPDGQRLVQETLGLDPKLRLPAGTQLNEKMAAVVEKTRQQPGGKRAVQFDSAQPMLIQVAARHCVAVLVKGYLLGRSPGGRRLRDS